MSGFLDQLAGLHAEWTALQPLAADRLELLWRKLRLEWNYHSNHLEGNTLTYGETELLLLHDRTTGHHSHREYLEMKAHDVAIEHVRRLAADPERLMTEADIRDLNRIILKEPFLKAAQTADGQRTQKFVEPGQYKTTPNNVRTATGETFYFASVEDTAPRMGDLARWLQQELLEPSQHPVVTAAKLHHDFVLIHPFDDGNGRVARLLANYVLMRAGYLPVIVRTEDKAGYLTALRLADAGDLTALIDYLQRAAESSLRLGIKAGLGGSIEEPSDIEKELAIFVRNQTALSRSAMNPKPETLADFREASLLPFLKKLDARMRQLRPLFEGSDVTTAHVERWSTGEQTDYETLRLLRPPASLTIFYRYYFYRGAAAQPFNLNVPIELRLALNEYVITQRDEVILANPYAKWILADEADRLTSQILSRAFEELRRATTAQS